MKFLLFICLIGLANIAVAGKICHKCKSIHHKPSCVVEKSQTNVKVVAQNKVINNIVLPPNLQQLQITAPAPKPELGLPSIRQFDFAKNVQLLPIKEENYVSPYIEATATNYAYVNAHIFQQILIENKTILNSNACGVTKYKTINH